MNFILSSGQFLFVVYEVYIGSADVTTYISAIQGVLKHFEGVRVDYAA